MATLAGDIRFIIGSIISIVVILMHVMVPSSACHKMNIYIDFKRTSGTPILVLLQSTRVL